MNEDYLLVNYMALLACILSKCTPERAIKGVIIDNEYNKNACTDDKRRFNGSKLGKHKSISVKMTNINTEEEWIFESCVAASNFLGASRTMASDYARTGKVYKNTYKFERIKVEK
ncbi:MAG: hypothetical protein ACRCX2_33990 [Paraclostridium sp.]